VKFAILTLTNVGDVAPVDYPATGIACISLEIPATGIVCILLEYIVILSITINVSIFHNITIYSNTYSSSSSYMMGFRVRGWYGWKGWKISSGKFRHEGWRKKPHRRQP
jgi:hypothetical protein